MKASAKSIEWFGYYLVVLGFVLIMAPNALLVPFGFAPTDEVWIRVLGIVVTTVGGYYVAMARAGVTSFFKATLFSRTWVFVTFTLLALLGYAKPALVLFGAVDLLGAIWTGWTLKQEGALSA